MNILPAQRALYDCELLSVSGTSGVVTWAEGQEGLREGEQGRGLADGRASGTVGLCVQFCSPCPHRIRFWKAICAVPLAVFCCAVLCCAVPGFWAMIPFICLYIHTRTQKQWSACALHFLMKLVMPSVRVGGAYRGTVG
ncbi:hypothetical protein Vafri_8675 [Volvox africanus]|uniref:Uncharacterized protein n=1 Tax=Volvox africanus TaxID=51714 RepID=A0A8J4B2R9_9CHLO|nr:hypothetical protein Vafri_8675 [Volvox africanus]